jgi:ribulose-phosphate 3-epimerase
LSERSGIKSVMAEIAPSILAADFARLGEAVEAVERGGAAIIHVDVMDGHFVPNITMGLPIVRSLARVTRLPLDAHLMIAEPARYVAQFAEAGARMVSVHVEAETHLHRTLMEIKRHGALAGVAINPATPLVLLEEALPYADYVVLMAVNPGFSGQAFIPTTIDKLRRLRRMIVERRVATRIEVDGGIELENAAEVAAAGADIIVAATAVFDSADPAEAVRKLREAAVQWV